MACIYHLEGSDDNDVQREHVMMYIQREHPGKLVKIAPESITLAQYQAMCEPGIRH